MIEKWADTMRETAVSELTAGRDIPGWKLVAGREGNRKWADEKAAEKLLTSWKLSTTDRYVKKLVSPTGAEKLQKSGKLTPEQWAELLPMITREAAKPALAPADDKRPAYRSTSAEDYPDETAATENKENNHG